MRLTEDQLATFRDRGVLRLPGFLPPGVVDPARAVLYRSLEQRGVWRDGAWCYEGQRPEWPNGGAQLVKGTKRSPTLYALVTDDLLGVVRQLVDGEPVKTFMDRAQVLFTLPNAATWTVPHSIWHLDMPRLGQPGCAGVQLFAMLDAVSPGGGGTLVVAGSHRLLNDQGLLRSREIKRRLKRLPFFAELMSREAQDRTRFLESAQAVDGVEQQVVELHGAPGDVYLTDLRVLHTVAPNASEVPRMMATQRFVPAATFAVWQDLYVPQGDG